MEQYIPKSVLVAEIDNMLNTKEHTSHSDEMTFNSGRWKALKKVKDINTLEVKEVDLEKENLTWKDIRELYIIFAEIDAEIEFCKTDIQGETIGYYQEALKRFKSIKKKDNYETLNR